MNRNDILLFIGLALLTTFTGYGQDQSANLNQPVTANVGSWSVELFNKSSKPFSVNLKIQVLHTKQGTVMELTTQDILLTSLLTTIPWPDLMNKYIQDVKLHPDFKDGFYGNQLLKSGEYQICLLLSGGPSGKDMPLAEGCNNFSVDEKEMLPPMLISPAHGDTIYQSSPVFIWSPPAPQEAQTMYSLYLYQIEKGQTPEAAVTKNQPYYVVDKIKDPLHSYLVSAKELKEKQSYAWQILAFVKGQVLPSNIENFVPDKTKTPPPVVEEPEKPVAVEYFQLNKEASSNFYHLDQSYLYFIYVNENTTPDLKYAILNEAEEPVLEGMLKAKYGFNFFTIDISTAKLDKNSFGQLLINKEKDPAQHLRFLFNPSN